MRLSHSALIRSLMLTGAAVVALSLAACQTTGSGTPRTSRAEVDAAVQKAIGQTQRGAAHKETLAALEQLYRRKSDDPDIAVRYARALRDAGRLNRALLVLNPFATDKGLRNPDVTIEFAAVHATMGQYEEAENFARAAVLMRPDSGQAYHILGIALDGQGQNKPAEVAFRKALDNWSGDPTPVLNNLGLNLAAQGFLDEAMSTLRRASALSPGRPEIERNLRIVQALAAQPGTSVPPVNKDNVGVKDPARAEAPKKPETKAPAEGAVKVSEKIEVTVAEEKEEKPAPLPGRKPDAPVKQAAEEPAAKPAKAVSAAPLEKVDGETIEVKGLSDEDQGASPNDIKPAADGTKQPSARPIVRPRMNE